MTSSLLMNKNMISKTMKSTRNNIKKSIRHQYTRLRLMRLTTKSTKRLKTMQKKLLSSQLKKSPQQQKKSPQQQRKRPQQLRKKHQLKQNDCINRYSF